MRSACTVALFFLFTWSSVYSYVWKKNYHAGPQDDEFDCEQTCYDSVTDGATDSYGPLAWSRLSKGASNVRKSCEEESDVPDDFCGVLGAEMHKELGLVKLIQKQYDKRYRDEELNKKVKIKTKKFCARTCLKYDRMG
ncbi:hypothetical protein OESDEN_13038 [Oesophagostomum dentatum]|uniref:Uncharacterized protein n=1 Tax=Oesophagostomum dentatum TaxID=61180 RepID=A0A0B1STK0_OESDE|nr:hypothetical protein OESDEN_13038 [Oesophagostomum dentatum]